MPKLQALTRISVRFVSALLGVGLLGSLVFRTGPGVVWEQVQTVGWGLFLIIILGGFSQLVKTWAWRQTFTCDIRGLPGPAVWARSWSPTRFGQLGVAGKLVGEGLRVSLVGPAVPLANGISACAIDGGLHIFTASVVAVLGITATLLLAPVSGRGEYMHCCSL